MSKTTRHMDFWKMRQLSRELSRAMPVGRDTYSGALRQDPGLRDIDDRFARLWSKYGNKSMVFDKRRRGSTRNANSEWMRELRRTARRVARQRLSDESTPDEYDRALRRIRPSGL